MKKILAMMMAAVMMTGLTACGGKKADTAAETTGTKETTVSEDSDFEEQAFEWTAIKITVTGMSVLTDGQNAGHIGLDMIIENLTDETLTLPACAELPAKIVLRYDEYPMGVKAGDNITLNADGTGNFYHEWELTDSSGEVIDVLSLELTVSKELMDESQAAGITYSDPKTEIPDSIEDTVLLEDDWVRISLADISAYAASTEEGYVMNGTLKAAYISGRELLITSSQRYEMSEGEGSETAEQVFAAGDELALTDHLYGMVPDFQVFVFDPEDIFSDGKDEFGIYYLYRGRVYNIHVELVSGEVVTTYTVDDTTEFAYCDKW